jgi:hypothetical protein
MDPQVQSEGAFRAANDGDGQRAAVEILDDPALTGDFVNAIPGFARTAPSCSPMPPTE